MLAHFGGLLSISLVSVLFAKNLGDFPIFQWDEARYVNNSLEILSLGNWFHFTMDGTIDTWNFKPPLVLWLQAMSMKIVGINELALRLPSFLASLGVLILLYWFCVSALQSTLSGITSVLFFGASCGFIGPHIGRTADLDAVQTFFVLWYTLYFLRYLLIGTPSKHLYPRLAVLVFLAFLCKGMPGLLLLPFLALIAGFPLNYKKVYHNPSVYVYGILTVVMCSLYYLLREMNYPGYWELLKKSEFNRFSGEGIKWHVRPFDFYFKNFTDLKRYFFLLDFLPFTLITFLSAKQRLIKLAYLYLLIITIAYFLFISYPPVKLEWYDAPLYPFFALLFGIFITETCKRMIPNKNWAAATAISCSLTLCIPHYRHIWEKIQYDQKKMEAVDDAEKGGLLMKQLQFDKPDEMEYTVLFGLKKIQHADQIKFYQKAFALRYGAKIQITDHLQHLAPGQKVLPANQSWSDSLHRYFPHTETLWQSGQGKLLLIK